MRSLISCWLELMKRPETTTSSILSPASCSSISGTGMLGSSCPSAIPCHETRTVAIANGNGCLSVFVKFFIVWPVYVNVCKGLFEVRRAPAPNPVQVPRSSQTVVRFLIRTTKPGRDCSGRCRTPTAGSSHRLPRWRRGYRWPSRSSASSSRSVPRCRRCSCPTAANRLSARPSAG